MNPLEKYAFGIKVMQFVNMNPVFKGSAVIIAGMLALLFAWFMRKKVNPADILWYKVFVGFSVFVVFYGSYILLLKPQWWKLPY